MPLESLPYELLLQVLTNIPDLGALDSFLRASPAAYRLFNNDKYAVEIFESILAAGCLCDHTQTLIRQIALLRSGARPFPSGYTEYTAIPVPPGVASFRRQVVEESLRHSSRQTPSKVGFVPQSLSADTSSATLRSILVTARQIRALSFDCLEFYLDGLKRFLREQGQLKPLKKKPPTWTEQQRCSRTIWRLQLVFDLKQAANNGSLGWSRKEIKSLNSIAAIGPPEDDWWLELQVSSFSQHWPLAGCGERFFYHSAAHHDCYYPDAAHPEKHEHATIMDYIRQVHGPDLAVDVNQGHLPVTVLAGRHEASQAAAAPPRLGAEHKEMIYASKAMQRYEGIRPNSSHCVESARRSAYPDINAIRRAGFALWSAERVEKLPGILYLSATACI